MKILVLSPGIPSALNSGLGIAANAINKELKSLVELIIVQPDNATVHTVVEENTIEIETETTVFSSESIAQHEIALTVSARLDPYHYNVTEELIHKSATEHSGKITKEIRRYSKQVVTKTKKIGFDLIYAHDWVTFQTALTLKEKTGKPFVAHVHSLDYDRGAARYRSFVYDIEKEALGKADAIIAVSNYTARILIKHYGIDPTKITVVYNAIVPFEQPQIQKLVPEKIILFVGRLAAQKGPEIFLEIAENLSSARADVRFVVVGDGDLYKQLVERSAKALLTKIHFTGHMDTEEVQKLLAMADIYCMPSVSEPFGLAAIEAAFAGVPVVLSDHAGAAEILKGAFLADPARPKSFVKHLETILDNPQLAKKSVAENLKCLEGLIWEASVKKIVKVFSNCMKNL